MNTYNITIPKSLAQMGDLVLVSREEYEKNIIISRSFEEFTPTTAEKKALIKAERNFKKGKTLSFNELANKLGFTN